MKFRLRSLEKTTETYKTQRKEFKLPYFEEISVSPVMKIHDEDIEKLNKFFYEFNGFTGIYQIGIETLDDSQNCISKEHEEVEEG